MQFPLHFYTILAAFPARIIEAKEETIAQKNAEIRMNESLGISKLAIEFWHNNIMTSLVRAKLNPTKIPFNSALKNQEALGLMNSAISPFFLLWVRVKNVIILVITIEKRTGGTIFFMKVELSSLNKIIVTSYRITVGIIVLTTKFPKKDFMVFSLIYFFIKFGFFNKTVEQMKFQILT